MDMGLFWAEARHLLKLHNLHGWKVVLGKARRRLGQCRYRAKTIEVSRFHAENDQGYDVLDTLRHEFAHAIVGTGHAHDAVWQAKARELGCDDRATASKEVCNRLAEAPHKFVARCNGCGTEFRYYRRPRRIADKHHRKCGVEKGKLTLYTVTAKPPTPALKPFSYFE